jgi:hypothetical protein
LTNAKNSTCIHSAEGKEGRGRIRLTKREADRSTHSSIDVIIRGILPIIPLRLHEKLCLSFYFYLDLYLYRYLKAQAHVQGGAKRTHVSEMGYLPAISFFGGYLKSKLYVRKPRTVDDLKVFIREEIATVSQEMLVNVMQNFEEKLRTCVR